MLNTCFKPIKAFLLTAFVMSYTCLSAQEVIYHDYELMKDSATTWISEFIKKHPSPNVNTVRKNFLDDFAPNNKVYPQTRLPKQRKKELSAKEMNRLCRPSSLAFFSMEKNPNGSDFKAYPMASAVAISEDGLCLTNFHVLSNVIMAGALKHYWQNDFMRFVMTHEGKVYPVKKVLAADPINDYAFFEVELAGDKLTPIPLGDPLEVGEEVYCLAHPQRNLFYLTEGIVSRNATVVDKNNGHAKLEMEITADYGVGSSGGPIIDSRGNLAGIVSSTVSLYADPRTGKNFQMTIKKTVPVKLIKECIINPQK